MLVALVQVFISGCKSTLHNRARDNEDASEDAEVIHVSTHFISFRDPLALCFDRQITFANSLQRDANGRENVGELSTR